MPFFRNILKYMRNFLERDASFAINDVRWNYTESQPKENNRPDVEIRGSTEVSSKLLIARTNNLVWLKRKR
ncbi:hypothetical protein ALC56_09936 [Trachymyrmex septentrionalis]|uniref:Uncharacterized protein n=1 Tax=Trachymyrmex septentrionalis TaxID=34720 RepID=A0A195F5T3_9HYME|nr:hypothetical protein ALC56_09936 [Trachymyrmex septentrionalis]